MNLKIAYWALYDFANSILLITFLFYFSQWLVVEQGRPAWWYNGALVGASLLFIVVAPRLSRQIDITGRKLGGLRFWSTLAVAATGATALIALLSNSLDLLATLLYALGMFAYLTCFLYYTPMILDLSSSANRGRVSGLGQGANSLGQVAGLLATLPFATGAVMLFGESGRAQTLLPAVALFILFALPMLLWYREERRPPAPTAAGSKSPLALFKIIFAYKPVAFMLVAYFFFSDALLTSVNNFPLYLEQVHGASDTLKALLTVAILTLAAIGAVGFGWLADKVGQKRTLMGLLLAYSILFPLMAFVVNLQALIPVFLVAGIFFGAVWGVSRSLVAQIVPANLTASSFSYYVVAERFATFIGPVVWSVALITVGESAAGYQVAFLSMTALLFVSLLFLNRVQERAA